MWWRSSAAGTGSRLLPSPLNSVFLVPSAYSRKRRFEVQSRSPISSRWCDKTGAGDARVFAASRASGGPIANTMTRRTVWTTMTSGISQTAHTPADEDAARQREHDGGEHRCPMLKKPAHDGWSDGPSDETADNCLRPGLQHQRDLHPPACRLKEYGGHQWAQQKGGWQSNFVKSGAGEDSERDQRAPERGRRWSSRRQPRGLTDHSRHGALIRRTDGSLPFVCQTQSAGCS
jgi:hypothetical protein